MRPRPERPAESEARRGGGYVSGTYALCGPGRPMAMRACAAPAGPPVARVRQLASQCAALPAPVGVSPRSARGCAPAVRVTVTCRSSPRRQFKSEINPKSANPGNRAPTRTRRAARARAPRGPARRAGRPAPRRPPRAVLVGTHLRAGAAPALRDFARRSSAPRSAIPANPRVAGRPRSGRAFFMATPGTPLSAHRTPAAGLRLAAAHVRRTPSRVPRSRSVTGARG